MDLAAGKMVLAMGNGVAPSLVKSAFGTLQHGDGMGLGWLGVEGVYGHVGGVNVEGFGQGVNVGDEGGEGRSDVALESV